MANDNRALRCLITDDTDSFKVRVPSEGDISDLGDVIWEKTKQDVLRDVSPHRLVLWKLNDSVPIDPHGTLTARIQSLGSELSRFAVQLENPADQVSKFFPQQPPEGDLHIIVQKPAGHALCVARTLYTALWNNPLDDLLDVTSDDSGRSFNYVPSAQIKRLRLNHLNYEESILFIRDEYISTLERLESRSLSSTRGGGVVVFGQPGIGKTVFLFYIIIHRLSEALPTALELFDDKFYLFTKDGASVHSSSETDNSNLLPPGTWALTDSNAMIGRPCSAFLATPAKEVWIVQAASPLKERWHEWSKQRKAGRYVMDLYTSNELVALGNALGLDVKQLLSHHETWGPSARTCLDLARGDLTEECLEQAAAQAADNFLSHPINMATLLAELDPTKVSHVLFAVRPQESRDSPTVEIPTDHLRGFIVRATAKLDIAQQTQFFDEICKHPWFKGSAGYIFEKFMHVQLLTDSSSNPLKATPARRGLPLLVIPVCKDVIPLGGLSLLKNVTNYPLPFYLRPTSQSFMSIDAIICTRSKILFIQSTVAPKHDLKPAGVDDILKNLPKRFRDKRDLCLVFITNTEECAATLRNQKLEGLGRMVVYSCVFKIGQSALTSEGKTLLEELTITEDKRKKANMPLTTSIGEKRTVASVSSTAAKGAKKQKRSQSNEPEAGPSSLPY